MRRCFYPSYLFIKWYLNVPKVQQDFVYEKNKDIKHNIFKGVRDVDCLFVGGGMIAWLSFKRHFIIHHGSTS